MSGAISPTNLSMYSPNVITSRGTQRSNNIPRWSAPLFTLDQEDFSMITHQTNTEQNTIILMDDTTAVATAAAVTTSSDHTGQCCNSANLMCDADRFFQTSDALENSARDTELQQQQPPPPPPPPKSP